MTHRVDTARQEAERARVIAIQAQYASKAAGQQERKAAAALGAQVALAQDSLDALRDIAQDSAASLDSVRQALTGSIQLADTLRIQVLIYMAAVDTLRERHAEERRAMSVALDRADSVLAHQDALIRALQKKAECRFLGRPYSPAEAQRFFREQLQSAATEEDILQFCAELPRYKRPRRVIFDQVPRNATGKIDKPGLRRRYNAEGLVQTESEN